MKSKTHLLSKLIAPQVGPVILLALVLLAAFFLRFDHFGSQGFFRDEPSAFTDSLHPLLEYLYPDSFRPVEINGIFYHVFVQHYWQSFCFSYSSGSPAILRGSSVVFSLLSILITYTIGCRLKSPALGLLAAAFLAINSLHLYYSDYLRFHMFNVFSVSLSFLVLLQAIERPTAWRWLIYFLLSLICIFSTLTSALILPGQWLYIYACRQHLEQKRTTIILGIGFFLALLSYWPFHHFDPGASARIAWYPTADGATVLGVFLSLLGIREHLLAPLTVITLVCLALLFQRGISMAYRSHYSQPSSQSHTVCSPSILVLLWFFVPLISLFLISHLLFPVLITRTALFVQPALALILAYGLTSLPRTRAWLCRAILLSLICIPTLLGECRLNLTYEWNLPLTQASFTTQAPPYRYQPFIQTNLSATGKVITDEHRLNNPIQYLIEQQKKR